MFTFKKTNTPCRFSAVKTIIFCGQKNILLRGHRVNGRINIAHETEPVHNDGNFSELPRFRTNAGDVLLRKHLETAPSDATYISENSQNEFIDCCKKEIQSTIIKRVINIFCETTDISNLRLTVQYE